LSGFRILRKLHTSTNRVLYATLELINTLITELTINKVPG